MKTVWIHPWKTLLIALILGFVMVYDSFGASVNYPIRVDISGDLDSLVLIQNEDGVQSDSSNILGDTTIVLDDTKATNLSYGWAWAGETGLIWDNAVFIDFRALQPTIAGRALDVSLGGLSGTDFSNTGGQIDAAEIATDAITSAKLAASAVLEIADSTHNRDTTNLTIAAGDTTNALWVSSQTSATVFNPQTDSVIVSMASFDTAFGAIFDPDTLFSQRTTDILAAANDDASVTIDAAAVAAIDTGLSDNHGYGGWETGGAGSGAFSVTFVAYDSANDGPVNNVTVAAYNTAQDNLLGSATTDINGGADINLDAGSYVVVLSAAGYGWPTYDTIAITGTQTDTILGYGPNVDVPAAANVCRVIGFLRELTGGVDQAVGQRVTATLKQSAYSLCDSSVALIMILPVAVDTVVDANGRFDLDLIYSSCLAKSGNTVSDTLMYYITVEGIDGEFPITVPDENAYVMPWTKQ